MSNVCFILLSKCVFVFIHQLSNLNLFIYLQVKTKLENPTHFHVQENQKRQIQMFLSHSQGKAGAVQSLPLLTTTMPSNIFTAQQPQSGSAPVDPDSPLSAGLSSAATSVSDVQDVSVNENKSTDKE